MKENSTDIKSILQNIQPIFSSTAIECAQHFLNTAAVVHKEFTYVETLNSSFDYLLARGANSEEFKSIILIGSDKNALNALLHKSDASQEDALDILGEFANTYLGMLQNVPAFTKNFGYIDHGLPSLYTGGNVFLPFISGVEGSIRLHDDCILYLSYSIREATPLRMKIEEFEKIIVEKRDNYLWITMPGSVNLMNYSELDSDHLLNFPSNSSGIVVDLSRINNMLSVYIRLIIRILERGRKTETPVFMVNASENCFRILESTNIHKIARIFRSEKDFWVHVC